VEAEVTSGSASKLRAVAQRSPSAAGESLQRVGLVLSGGGARGAYQVGVLRGIFEVASQSGLPSPFRILTGVSAGAINVAYLAAHAGDYIEATQLLQDFWANLRTDQVFKVDPWSLSQTGLHWLVDAVSGGSTIGHRARALLDTSPLAELMRVHLDVAAIRGNLDAKHLDSVAVSATDYASTECMTFCMSRFKVKPWQRSRRVGVAQNIEVGHVLASAAIPFFFPPVSVAGRYYGDGCLRNTAPLSPAVHLGADKLCIIGVRKAAGFGVVDIDAAVDDPPLEPSIARVLNTIINAVLLDGVDADIERLSRINHTVDLLAAEAKASTTLKSIDWLYFHPSVDIAQIAIEEASAMPRIIRYLMAGLGSLAEAADMVSYLLFEPSFLRRLLDLGYSDAISRQDEIRAFLKPREALVLT